MTFDTNICAFIFARGGSKGLPGKNIKMLAGKPLLAYSIETAKQVAGVKRVIVSTDNDAIAEVARAWGAEVPFMRPAELALDDTPEWRVWQHALKWLKQHHQLPELFVSLPATSPLRSVSDVEKCIEALDKNTDMVVTVTEAHRSPWFNMLSRDEQGFCQVLLDNKEIYRRQDAPEVFDMTTVAYVARSEFILSHERVFDGRVKAVEIPKERAADIDTALDFAWAEFLLGSDYRDAQR